jgi:hypothetical protein
MIYKFIKVIIRVAQSVAGRVEGKIRLLNVRKFSTKLDFHASGLAGGEGAAGAEGATGGPLKAE